MQTLSTSLSAEPNLEFQEASVVMRTVKWLCCPHAPLPFTASSLSPPPWPAGEVPQCHLPLGSNVHVNPPGKQPPLGVLALPTGLVCLARLGPHPLAQKMGVTFQGITIPAASHDKETAAK